jgi:hypothetical protein
MSERIEIDQIKVTNILVPIIGTSPLIMHNWSEKQKRAMLQAQQGKRAMKDVRDPEAEYQAAFYRIAREGQSDGYGFPVTGFKAAIVGAARFYGKSIKMTELKQFIFMRGVLTKADPQQLVEIVGQPEMREDVVRLGGMNRSADLRYRPEFKQWSAVLDVTFVQSSLSQGSVLSLIDAAGLGVGVGEWRPERRGEFGCFTIDQSKDIEVRK